MKRSVRAWFSHKENLALVILIGLAVFKLVIHLLTSSTFPLPWNQNIHRAGLAADQVLSMNTISIDRGAFARSNYPDYRQIHSRGNR